MVSKRNVIATRRPVADVADDIPIDHLMLSRSSTKT